MLGLVTAGVLVWLGVATLRVPFAGQLPVPVWLYVPLAAFVFVATINAVAITDGMDSLAATTGAIALTAFWVIALWQGDGATGALAGTVAGALLAYLWFNAHPAQMFMGDIGALPLGGLLATVALTAAPAPAADPHRDRSSSPTAPRTSCRWRASSCAGSGCSASPPCTTTSGASAGRRRGWCSGSGSWAPSGPWWGCCWPSPTGAPA